MAPGRRHVERRLLLLVVEVEAGARLAEDLHDPGEAVPGGDVKAGLLVLQREECEVGWAHTVVGPAVGRLTLSWISRLVWMETKYWITLV